MIKMTIAVYGRSVSRGSCSSHSTIEMTVATSRMITRKFSNCSSSRFHHGVSGALLIRFGPYCSKRRCTSAWLKPRATFEPSAATTASAGIRCGMIDRPDGGAALLVSAVAGSVCDVAIWGDSCCRVTMQSSCTHHGGGSLDDDRRRRCGPAIRRFPSRRGAWLQRAAPSGPDRALRPRKSRSRSAHRRHPSM